MGGKHRFTVDRVEFAGYGLDAPGAGHVDFRGKDVKDAAVVWLGNNGPKNIDLSVFRRVLSGRNRYATEQLRRGREHRSCVRTGRRRTGRTRRRAGIGRRRGARREVAAARRCRRPTSPRFNGSTRRHRRT